MTINRHNYEEFFILYLDNELSSGDRRQVELFAQQHPDLGEELQMLQQTRLDIDPSIVFEGKESLMKTTSQGFINTNTLLGFIKSDNYEEWLVQYVDNELTQEQKAAVETYANNNAAVRAELDLMLKTKLQPEASITFIDKESLYRKEETPVRRIVPVMWWRIAAAVLLLIALTFGGVAIFKKDSTPDNTVATTQGNQNSKSPEVVKEKKLSVEEKSSLATTSTDQAVKEEVIKQKDDQATFAKKTDNRIKIIRKPVEEDVPVIAVSDNKNANNLPSTDRNPNINGSLKDNAVIAAVDKKALTELKPNTLPPLVTSGTAQSFIQAKNTLTNDNDVAVNEPENKTKFRGLLRKITRTFEKTTNIKATDDDDRLLVAGLAIRL